jgi:hypothetical protein
MDAHLIQKAVNAYHDYSAREEHRYKMAKEALSALEYMIRQVAMSFRCEGRVEPPMSRQDIFTLAESVCTLCAEFGDLFFKAKQLRYIASFHATFVVENNKLLTHSTCTSSQLNDFQIRMNSLGGLAFYDDVKSPTQILQLYIAGLFHCHALVKQLFGFTMEAQMVSLAP